MIFYYFYDLGASVMVLKFVEIQRDLWELGYITSKEK